MNLEGPAGASAIDGIATLQSRDECLNFVSFVCFVVTSD